MPILTIPSSMLSFFYNGAAQFRDISSDRTQIQLHWTRSISTRLEEQRMRSARMLKWSLDRAHQRNAMDSLCFARETSEMMRTDFSVCESINSRRFLWSTMIFDTVDNQICSKSNVWSLIHYELSINACQPPQKSFTVIGSQ